MNFTIEFEVKDLIINEPNLSEKIIKEQLFKFLEYILDCEASNTESEHPELYIDVSDDGDDSRYNIYYLKIVQ